MPHFSVTPPDGYTVWESREAPPVGSLVRFRDSWSPYSPSAWLLASAIWVRGLVVAPIKKTQE